MWYLMTPNWNEAPKRLPDPAPKATGTEAPIDASFTSAFAGGSLADVAGYLRNKPEIVDLDPTYFGVLDKQADWGRLWSVDLRTQGKKRMELLACFKKRDIARCFCLGWTRALIGMRWFL